MRPALVSTTTSPAKNPKQNGCLIPSASMQFQTSPHHSATRRPNSSSVSMFRGHSTESEASFSSRERGGEIEMANIDEDPQVPRCPQMSYMATVASSDLLESK